MGKVCKKSWIAAIFLGVMLFAAGFAFQASTVEDVYKRQVKETSTEDPGLAEQTGADTNNAGESSDSSTGIPDATEDGTVNTDGSSDGTTEDTPQESTDSSTDNSSSEEILSLIHI